LASTASSGSTSVVSVISVVKLLNTKEGKEEEGRILRLRRDGSPFVSLRSFAPSR
jgi:hypothetical protein